MYIEQGRKGTLGLWKYIVPPLGFFGLMIVNTIFSMLMRADTETLMQEQIETLGKPIFFLIAIGPFVVFLGSLFFWVKFVHQQSITSLTTSRKKIDWKRVFFMFGVMTLFIGITTYIGYVTTPEDYEINFKLQPFLILVVMALLLVPIQTSFEEYFFRGYLMQGLGIATKKRWIPFILTSVLFGLMHIANPEVGKIGPIIMVYYIGTGFFLAIMTLMDEGLELALGFHAANNLVTALLVTSTWTAFQTDSILVYTGEPEASLDVLFPVLVIFPIILFILSKVYKWSDWKNKLFGNVLPASTKEE